MYFFALPTSLPSLLLDMSNCSLTSAVKQGKTEYWQFSGLFSFQPRVVKLIHLFCSNSSNSKLVVNDQRIFEKIRPD